MSSKSDIRFSSEFLEGSKTGRESSYEWIPESVRVFPDSKSARRNSSRHFNLAKCLSACSRRRCGKLMTCSSSIRFGIMTSNVPAMFWTLPCNSARIGSSFKPVILSKSTKSDGLSLSASAKGVTARGVVLSVVSVFQVIWDRVASNLLVRGARAAGDALTGCWARHRIESRVARLKTTNV